MPDPDLKGQLFSTTDETQMTDKNLLGNSTPKSSQYYNFHDLNQQCTSSKPDLVVIFFHGIGLGKNDEWKETWMSINSDGKRVHWPQEWLPADLASKNEVGAELRVGYQGTHLKGSLRKTGTNGDTSAQGEAYENCTSSDVWRGFIYQDLSSTK
ncbi:unnamed protein product [Sphagnum troendelagicum]|uniref:Uncharacterized protein n=1 Tax=Sphagnum troendelagicum TaxID=128251 RepID=A0ABP0UQZ6_9BRYO